MNLFNYLTKDTVILTPNRRLSATLLKIYNNQQVNMGETSWTTLDALPVVSWIQRLWQDYCTRQMVAALFVINSSHEQILWEEILKGSAESEHLLQLSSTAELARQAFNTLQQWCINLDNPVLQTTEDSIIFHKWAQKFQALCEENNWLTSSSVTNRVIEKIQSREIIPPAHIILTGFTEISPQYQAVLTACEAANSQIVHYQQAIAENLVQRIGLPDEETEIRTMALWAKAKWEENPATTVGCIFPRLETLRDKVIQIFSEVFAQKNTFSLNYSDYPFNISAGKNLSLYPVIHAALKLLHLKMTTTSLDTMSSLLLSPFIGEAESEMLSRAKYANTLRQTNISSISLKKIADYHSPLNKSCPALAIRLRDFIIARNQAEVVQPISGWIETFMHCLNLLGWPGERSLNSHEYQVVDRWLKLLIDYASFDNILGSINYQQALHYLNYLTSKEIFQPESPETPIQILGMLEAAETPFDYLWVMGLDDTVWPPSPKPNPFIPQRLQKNLQMPHATAERELIYCQQLTEQLKHGAGQVIFSCAMQGEEAELRPSPIISNLPEIMLNQLGLADFTAAAKLIYAQKKMEAIQDDIAPAIAASETIRGGANIFKLQAACPFKAFAELRLHVKSIDTPVLGLSPKDRGNIVHKALEIIWSQLGDLDNLLNCSDLETLIENSVAKAVAASHSEALSNARYRLLEVNRLKKLFAEWFENEKTRRYFKVIALEQEHTITIANIPVVLRVDRIDELDNGKRIVIDYKTGKSHDEKQWFGDRPDEPQLPLYCTLDPINTAGILFAELSTGETGFVGISTVDLGIKSVKPLEKIVKTDWQTQVQEWRTTLEKLGRDFAEGKAAVNPKSPVTTCKHCHLKPLCRIED